MKNLFSILFLASLLLTFSSCKDEIDCELFHWSYEGDSGPDRWSGCHTGCGGTAQSPVDISSPVQEAALPALNMHYDEVPVSILHNGHTIEFEYEPGSHIEYGGKQYQLLQFHFHADSEHSIGGQLYPLEVHLVHKDTASGNLLVIGIIFEEGNANPFLDRFIADLPDEKDEHFTSADKINVIELLPSTTSYYTYSGSLTTPPCSEIVTWVVMKEIIEISAQQLEHISDILDDNNRPVQPLNGRVVKESL